MDGGLTPIKINQAVGRSKQAKNVKNGSTKLPHRNSKTVGEQREGRGSTKR